jgi:hypothetical protein
MRDPKQYAPVADDAALQAADKAIKEAIESGVAQNLVVVAQNHSTKIGHKAFVYLMTGKVTIEMMLANKSGISKPNPDEKIWSADEGEISAEELLQRAKDAKLAAMKRFGLVK